MEYEVVAEVYENAEFDFVLYQGDILVDGDLEPDLMAQLVASGVVAPEGGTVVEPAPEPEDEDE